MSDDNGLANLQAAFNRFYENSLEGLEAGITAACILVKGDALQKAPVDTGRLKNSITYQVEIDGDTAEGIVGANTEYAAAQEFGVPGRSRPQPYMEPALNQNRSAIIALVASAIMKVKV